MDIDFLLLLFIITLVAGIIILLNKIISSKLLAVWCKKADAFLTVSPFAKLYNAWLVVWRWLVDTSRSLFIVLLLVFCVRAFLFEPFRVPSGSMKPTIAIGDFLLVSKLSYGIRLPIVNKQLVSWSDIERGDIIVFNFPSDQAVNFIKRVVGLPGDKITYDGSTLTVNSTPMTTEAATSLNQDGLSAFYETNSDGVTYTIYRTEMKPIIYNKDNFVVPDGHYFVMGDNRDNSNDSRFWGSVQHDLVQGKALFVWMHWKDFGGMPSFSEVRRLH